jgi:hypothetical protein
LDEQISEKPISASFIEAFFTKNPSEEEEAFSSETIASDLSQQLYFRLKFFVSPSEEFITALSTGFLPYGAAPTKEQ